VQSRMAPEKLARLLKIPLLGKVVRRKVLEGLGLGQCKVASCGGAPMPAEVLRWYASLGIHIAELYGMTENAGNSHSTYPDRFSPGTVGFTYDGVESRIDVDSEEIQVKTKAAMLGYYRASELSAKAFTADGWLHTGDQGRLDPDGSLRITGRIKDNFKTSKGKFVAPLRVEQRLEQHVEIESCCVLGASLPQPLGVVTLTPAFDHSATNIEARQEMQAHMQKHLDWVNEGLDPYERLSCIVVETTQWTVQNDLLTPTLKIKRNRIEALYASRVGNWPRQDSKVCWIDQAVND
jgi:long-chain acyl-CoA synthetase